MTHVGHEPLANDQGVLVRMWRDDDDSPWRASAPRPGSEDVLRFASLEHLFVFLQQQTREAAPSTRAATMASSRPRSTETSLAASGKTASASRFGTSPTTMQSCTTTRWKPTTARNRRRREPDPGGVARRVVLRVLGHAGAPAIRTRRSCHSAQPRLDVRRVVVVAEVDGEVARAHSREVRPRHHTSAPRRCA